MLTAILFIKITPTKEREVRKSLEELAELLDCHALFGEYDLIAKIETDNFPELRNLILEKLENIPGIIDIKVSVAAPPKS